MHITGKILFTLFLILGYGMFFGLRKINSAIAKDAERHGNQKKADDINTYLKKKKSSMMLIYPIIAIVLIILVWANILVIPFGRVSL